MSHGSDDAPADLDRRAFLKVIARRVAIAVVAFGGGLLVDEAWARAVRGPRLEKESYPHFVLGRYRIHHNVVGYLLILGGLFGHPLVLVPLGLGMIVGHARRDRLYWFVERVK